MQASFCPAKTGVKVYLQDKVDAPQKKHRAMGAGLECFK
jgi:hypothetical protein